MWGSVIFLLLCLLLFIAILLLSCFRDRTTAALGHLAWRIRRRLRFWLYLPQGGSERPQLICKPSTLAHYLLQHCGSLGRPCTPDWPWLDPHLQTLCSLVWPLAGSEIDFARDHLQLRDGGIVALDWAVGVTIRNWKATGPSSSSSPPVLIIIPNSWGRLTPHVLGLCRLALEQGFYPVVFHRRGQGGCPLVTPSVQQFGDPSDLMEAVSYIRFSHPSAALLAVSEGSGSGLLLSYLGECGSSSYLTCAACISPVFRGQQWFESPLPWLYRWALLLYQKLNLCRYSTALSEVMDTHRLFSCTSLQQFEELQFCTGGTGKQSSLNWESYWERNEPLRDADEVAVPVLCLCSWDDPIRGDPRTTLPLELFETSPFFLLALTHWGGHCGFQKESGHGDSGTHFWSQAVLMEYFRVVAEFFRAEERRSQGRGPPPRRRTSTLLPRRRRGTLQRDPPATDDIFSWHRSYTR
ncbi:protein ABHD15-like [Huso huso]|uniref:Protein ABHD15-like n=1 Tax=Huso huso TaxID=61971 RepID=A0ABR0YL48_HUSHU